MTATETTAYRREPNPGSSRNLGLIFAGAFGIVGFAPLVLHNAPPRWWSLVLAVIFLVCAMCAPRLLDPLNRAWFKFGLALHHIVNPIIMGLIFYGAMVPTGLILRMLGMDLLRLKRDPGLVTYWIPRTPPAPSPGSMSKQF